MTLRTFAMVCCWLWLAALGANAQGVPATKTAESFLAPVAWFVGGTWVSDVKDLSDGTTTHVESHITWAPNHAAIQFVTDFNGKPHYSGFYAYDAAQQAIRFYYTAENGDLTIGTATPDPDGKTLRQDFDIAHLDGKTGHVRSTVARDGDNAYWFTVFLQKDGQWSEVFKIRYERK